MLLRFTRWRPRLMETEPADFTAVYYDAVDHFSHAFMPYHPPRLEWVNEEDFELYKDVVRGAYRFHDMMLERLASARRSGNDDHPLFRSRL